MKDKLYKVFRHPLISGSAIIFLGTNIGNLFNLFFNFFMLRNLTATDYGVLVSLISIITLFAYMAESFTPSVVNFASIFFVRKEIGKVKSLFVKIAVVSALLGFSILVSFMLFSQPISHFLNIQDSYLFIVTGFCILFAFLGVVNKSFLQAKLAFFPIAIIIVLGSASKLATGVFFVLSDLRVYGALFAFMISFFLPYLFSFVPLRFLFNGKVKKEAIDVSKLFSFGFPAALSILGLTFFITIDILLVKHFFNPTTAGLYAGISVVAKIIFFFSAPIGTVMFPLIVRKHANKEDYHKDFFLALILILLPSLGLTIIYFLFPELIIRFVMKRSEYQAGVGILGFFGLYLTIYSLLYVITNFYLSIQKTKVYLPIFFFVLLQTVGIWLYHDSLSSVLFVSLSATSLLLLVLLLYYWKVIYKNRSTIMPSTEYLPIEITNP